MIVNFPCFITSLIFKLGNIHLSSTLTTDAILIENVHRILRSINLFQFFFNVIILTKHKYIPNIKVLTTAINIRLNSLYLVVNKCF